MSDIENAFPRVALVMAHNGEVAQVSIMEASPDRLDKKQQASAHAYWERVPAHVMAGMRKQDDGTFDWPEGHPNESWDVRKAREAAAKESVLKAGRAA